MSRLESMRRRLTAQIDGLNWGLAETANLTGDILELGLGNGRTYDHLREYGGGRRVAVIDRQLNCHPSCIPPEADFFQGEADDMLRQMSQNGMRFALVHFELGIGVEEHDNALSAKLAPLIAPLLVPGAIVVTQNPLPGFTAIPGPDSVEDERYLFYTAPV